MTASARLLAPLAVLGAWLPAPAAQAQGEDCTKGEVRLLTDFEGAGAKECRRTPEGFELVIAPETVPINRSPWYAFDIASPSPAEVTVELDYAYGTHRYVPKIAPLAWSGNGEVPTVDFVVSEDEDTATLTIAVPAGRFRISAQPVIPAYAHRNWALDLAGRSDFAFGVEGTSRQGRDIWRLTSAPAQARHAVLLLGGQHPPEVPGTIAMREFVERLAESDPLARRFRAHFRIDAFPMLNPDGLAHGYWRTTTDHEDLNRDWGIFSQTESALVDDFLARTAAPVLMVDFHATRAGDVLYVPQSDAEGVEPFLSSWIARIDALLPDEPGFEPITGNNPGLPTARSWFTRTFTAPGVTLEIGDETDPQRTARLARAAAEAMMAQLLDQYSQAETDR